MAYKARTAKAHKYSKNDFKFVTKKRIMFKQTKLELQNQVLNAKYNELFLQENLPTVDDTTHLSDTQRRAYDFFKNGENVLILGPAGTGKSTCLKTFYEYSRMNGKNISITATTGIAAYNIEGITIHSFMGFGTGKSAVETLFRKMNKKKDIIDRLRQIDILVIDEISMLSAELFEKIDTLCRRVRKNIKPFGGIQLVCSGDLLQLLPVFKTKGAYPDLDTRLIVESELFQKVFKKNTVTLCQNFRQENSDFSKILNRIRVCRYTENDISMIESRKKQVPPSGTINLVTSNKKASVINTRHLDLINSQPFYFTANMKKSGADTDTLNVLESELVLQFENRSLMTLELKVGTRVMLVKNLDTIIGLVNGAIGTVVEFRSGNPVVKFDNGYTKCIEKVEWSLELGENKCVALQVPLILAWCITIHKSQSLTLDSAVLDLDDCFCEHQVYVALSRLRSLDGLFLKSFQKSKITINTTMKNYLELLGEKP